MKVGRCNFLCLYWSVTKFESQTSHNKIFSIYLFITQSCKNTVKISYKLAISAYIRAIIRLRQYLSVTKNHTVSHILTWRRDLIPRLIYAVLYGFFISWIRYWSDDGLNVARNC